MDGNAAGFVMGHDPERCSNPTSKSTLRHSVFILEQGPQERNDAMTSANPATLGSSLDPNENQSQGSRSAEKTPVAVEKPFSVRGFTSMLLVLCLLMLLASGIALYLAPRGRVANVTSWTALALSRQQWAAVHINASILFVAVTATHLVMNWSRMVGYLKKRARPGINMKKELASAVAVACVIFAGTTLELPPISLPVEFKYDLRDAWERDAREQRVEPRVSRNSPEDRRMNTSRPTRT